MKKSKISEVRIFEILKEAETGISIDDLCRKLRYHEAPIINFVLNLVEWLSRI